ncbi:MAG: nucleotide exchange factor GrpE [Ardenticatenia bacterium]|nr:nucleotide exchange factor GrpE [Ardenticatenia bacterium]
MSTPEGHQEHPHQETPVNEEGTAMPTDVDAEPQEAEPRPEEPEDVRALQVELAEARRQAEEYLDQWRRTAADFANFRKRKERELAEFEQRANERLIARLLPVLDDLQRALEHVPEDLKEHEWVEGVRLIERKFWGVLEQEGVQPIESSPGTPFDPMHHEALMSEESGEHEPEHIIEEYQRGYLYRGRVLRPARVRVAR